MEIVEQLSAEFQIQLVVKLVDAVADMLRLHFQVLLIVKSNLHGIFLPFFHGICLKETDHSCRDDAKFSPLGSEELQTTDFILL